MYSKDKFTLEQGCEGPDREQTHSSALSLTLEIGGGGFVKYVPVVNKTAYGHI
jgi:hypothetical protein